MLAQGFFWKHPETETVILRPVHIVGRVHNAPSNFLRLPTIPTLLGFDPMVQVIHEEDVVRAIGRALRPRAARHLQRRGPGAAAALAHREAPRQAEHPDPVHVRQGDPEAPVALPPDDVPGAGARSHPLRLHGRRPPRARRARLRRRRMSIEDTVRSVELESW